MDGALKKNSFCSKYRRLPTEDSELKTLIGCLQESRDSIPTTFRRSLPSFSLRSGVVYTENQTPQGATRHLALPVNIHHETLESHHDEASLGHLGYRQTLVRIRGIILAKIIHHYVRTCRECQRRKTPPVQPSGYVEPVATPRAPFEQIGMDLLGPFPRSSPGNRIIFATDSLTRQAETKALPQGQQQKRQSPSLRVSCFGKGLLPSYSLMGNRIAKQTGPENPPAEPHDPPEDSLYHPQTNGLIGRLNGIPTGVIPVYVDVAPKTWDQTLSCVAPAHNMATYEITSLTSFHLAHR